MVDLVLQVTDDNVLTPFRLAGMGELILGCTEMTVDIKIVALRPRDINFMVHQLDSLLQHNIGLLERGNVVPQSGVLCYDRVLNIVHQLSLSIGECQIPINRGLHEVIRPS
jgi:hypothetical protein